MKLVGSLALCAVCGAGWSDRGAAQAEPDYTAHVVTLSVTYQRWDEDRPWSKYEPGTRTVDGVVVGDDWILVSAESIWDAAQIEVSKRGQSDPFQARVVHMDPDVNLALVTTDDAAFFGDLMAARVAATMPVSGDAPVVRWVERQLQVAPSSVDRITASDNLNGLKHAVLVLRDVDGGGWGTPVFAAGALVGVVTSASDGSAEAIPCDIVARYLQMARNPATYAGFSGFSMFWQLNRQRAQSPYLGAGDSSGGVLVTQLIRSRTPSAPIQPRDVIVSIDGHAIDGEGYYDHPQYGRLGYHAIALDQHVAGDEIEMRVLRGGRSLNLTVPLRRWRMQDSLMPWRRPAVPPPYAVFGGLVFRELDGEYMRTWEDWRNDAPERLSALFAIESNGQVEAGRRVVILSSVLADQYNIGYHDLRDLVVASINGVEIGAVGDVVRAFGEPKDGFHTVALASNPFRGEVVLDAAGLESAQARIAEGYGLPALVRLPAR